MLRYEEIRQLLSLSPEEVRTRAGERLVVCSSLDDLHLEFAARVSDEIQLAADESRPCRLILPVGPTGGYPFLAQIISKRKIDLSHCWFFFMDEYSDNAGHAVPADHPLSFKGVMKPLFFDRLPEGCGLNHDQVIFPNRDNIDSLAGRIEEGGGIDACFGGIGIHGHVAFNEPEPGVAELGPRRVILNDFTVTINAVRAHVGGNLEGFPRTAYTLGMKQILDADRIVLFARNGTEFDWANTVLRLALFGEPGDDYPVTHIRDRNYVIVTDNDTLQSPRNVL